MGFVSVLVDQGEILNTVGEKILCIIEIHYF
jgi:hypothetical protein